MATGIRVQPQRIPFGYFTAPNGQQIPVTISREWYRQLEQIAAAVGVGGGDGEEPDEGIEPYAWPGAGAQDHDVGMDGGPELSAVPAVLFEHSQGLQALAIDAMVPALLAAVAALASRIEALEQGNTP